jgi:hypothetical protein
MVLGSGRQGHDPLRGLAALALDCAASCTLALMSARILCDIHGSEMEYYECLWSVSAVDQWPKALFRCTCDGCTRQFAPAHGYIDLLEQRIDSTRRNARGCSTSAGAHGSMAIVDFADGCPIWVCLQPDCAYTLIVTPVSDAPAGTAERAQLCVYSAHRTFVGPLVDLQILREKLTKCGVFSQDETGHIVNEAAHQQIIRRVMISDEQLSALGLRARSSRG